MKNKFFLILVIFLSISIVNADSNGVWVYSKDIRGGIFGSDEQDFTTNFVFINDVKFNQSVNLKELIALDNSGLSFKTDDKIDRLIIKDNGFVGIGVEPSNNLDVNGDIRIRNKKNCDFTYTDLLGNIECGEIGEGINFSNGKISVDSIYLEEMIGVITGDYSSYSGLLVNDIHTGDDCFDSGGQVYYDSQSDIYMCKFSGDVCKTGWSQYQNWQTAIGNTCYTIDGGTCGSGNSYSCTPPSFGFSNNSDISCIYDYRYSYSYYSAGKPVCGSYMKTTSCNSKISEIGCY